MKLRESVGVFDHYLGRKRPGLYVASLLELQQVPAVAENWSLGKSLENAFGQVSSNRTSTALQSVGLESNGLMSRALMSFAKRP